MTTYWITAVDHLAHGPINKVCAFETAQLASGWSLGAIKPYTRQQIVNGISARTAQLYTCTWDATKSVWSRGAEVVLTKDGNYITTVGNNSTRDNLGNLPACNC